MNNYKNILALLISSFIFHSCEISHSVPFDFPEYKPELIIHAIASPQSGATALIKYNQPVNSFPGQVPKLPPMVMYLLKEGQIVQRFRQDSITIVDDNQYQVETVHFSIVPDSMVLEQDVEYALRVIDQGNDEIYESSSVFLPPEPDVNNLNIDCPSFSDRECFVTADLGPVDELVPAISITGRYLDKAIIDDYFRLTNTRLLNPDLIYPDVDSWKKFLATATLVRSILPPFDDKNRKYEVRLSIAYLSYDLAQLIREINGTHAIGEDIFVNLRPFHSNISNAFGVFGLYNEDVRELEL